jgi:hypothetical protein
MTKNMYSEGIPSCARNNNMIRLVSVCLFSSAITVVGQYSIQYIQEDFLKSCEGSIYMYTVARLFQTFSAKVVGKFEKIRPLQKNCIKHLFRHLLYSESKRKFNFTAYFLLIPKKKSKKIQRIIGFLLKKIVKIFSSLFSANFV